MITALLILFIFLQIADCFTTIYILGKGGIEKNPILFWLFNLIGVWQTLVIMKVVAVAAMLVVAKLTPITTALFVLCICNLLYLGVVGWNGYQIYKTK